MIKFISNRTISSHLRPSFTISPNFALFSHSLSLSTPSSTVNSDHDSSKKDSFTVNYLINSCGFTPESALSASNLINIKTHVKPDSVLAFLKNYGFTGTQILLVVRKYPLILLADPEKTLLPKFEFFGSIGLSRADLTKFVTTRPYLLRRSLKNHLVPSFRYFEDLLQSNDKVLAVIKRCPRLLEIDLQVYLIPNIQFLQEIGVPKSSILALLAREPRSYISSEGRFRRNVEKAKDLGFNPSQIKFLTAVRAFMQMSESTWEKKVELLKKWGWSEDEVFQAFGKYPGSLMVSEEKINGVMEFFINKMGLKSSFVANRPVLLTLSLEKRIIPRSLVYQVLRDRGLIKKHCESGFRSWLQSSESEFECRIRKKYKKEAPELLKTYQKSLDLTNVAYDLPPVVVVGNI